MAKPVFGMVVADQILETYQSFPEVSVVIPCLNEADTIASCIGKAKRALEQAGILGEVIVADNGSGDGSQAIAGQLGARLINVREKGYGSALMGGIMAARGKFIIMGDADDSYDFLEIPKFVHKLREGFDIVQGCRLPSGGGTVKPGAMPWLHLWCGNPLFSFLARWWFNSRLHDVHCGLRGFRKDVYFLLDQRCTGMEFATEMIIKASLNGAKTVEIPITLFPDGRIAHAPHLRTFRDGWRHLRFYLMCSPKWLFLVPGAGLILVGILGYGIAMPRLTINGITFDVHTLAFSSLSILCGYQSVLFALLTKIFAISEGLLPEDSRMNGFFERVSLEKGLLASMIGFVMGLGILLTAFNQWRLTNFGPLDYTHTMRLVIPGMTLTALGFQTILSSFFVSILGMRRR